VSLIASIRQLLSALEPDSVELSDESGNHLGHAGSKDGGGHFNLTIVSPLFAGVNRVERHRRVYEALAPLLGKEIHALAIRALAPNEL
jgi:BolA protein